MNTNNKTEKYSAKIRGALMGDTVLEDVHEYRVNRHTFSVYIGGDPSLYNEYGADSCPEPGVEYRMADRFDVNLNILSGIDPTRPILVHVASCGGYWTEGMQMFGAILTCPNPVTVLATKWARSMTSLIPLAADKFIIRPPARYMFHHGTVGYNGLSGEEFDTFAEEHSLSRKIMLDIYVARLKSQGAYKNMIPVDIREMLKEKMRRKVDAWLSAKEAVRWGFADGVYTGNASPIRAAEPNLGRRRKMLAAIS